MSNRRKILATVKVVQTGPKKATVELAMPSGDAKTKYDCLTIALRTIVQSVLLMKTAVEAKEART